MANQFPIEVAQFPYSDEYEKGYVFFSNDGLNTAKVHLNKKGTNAFKPVTTYARYLMEVHLGRFLEKNERVFHKDKNRLNHSIDNLEIKVTGQSTAKNEVTQINSRQPKMIVELVCAYCKTKFQKEKRLLAVAATNRFCSKGCQHAYYNKFKKASANVFHQRQNVNDIT